MSKMDAQRAMREARYEKTMARAAARAKAAPKTPTEAAPGTAPPPVRKAAETGPAAAEPAEELCGHKNIGGRTCTRERGHAAKSHRYS